jgi:hypothetical protein
VYSNFMLSHLTVFVQLHRYINIKTLRDGCRTTQRVNIFLTFQAIYGFHHEHTPKMHNFKNMCTTSGHSALLTLTCMNHDNNTVIEVWKWRSFGSFIFSSCTQIKYGHVSGVPWLIIMGSGLDDWIYWHLLQSLLITISYSSSQLMTV